MTKSPSALSSLEWLVGEWSMEARFDSVPAPGTARVVFEWLPGRQFIVERWKISTPEAPDGIAVIGADPEGEGYLQHYFDSRGVARVYKMTFEDSVWRLWRDSPDFSPLDFRQRFIGVVSGDGATVEATWEIATTGSRGSTTSISSITGSRSYSDPSVAG